MPGSAEGRGSSTVPDMAVVQQSKFEQTKAVEISRVVVGVVCYVPPQVVCFLYLHGGFDCRYHGPCYDCAFYSKYFTSIEMRSNNDTRLGVSFV